MGEPGQRALVDHLALAAEPPRRTAGCAAPSGADRESGGRFRCADDAQHPSETAARTAVPDAAISRIRTARSAHDASIIQAECNMRLRKCPLRAMRLESPVGGNFAHSSSPAPPASSARILCDRLLAEGHAVVGVDNFHHRRARNLAHLGGNPHFEFIEQDVSQAVRDPRRRRLRAQRWPRLRAPRTICEHPIETLDVGSLGTRNMLELAHAKRARASWSHRPPNATATRSSIRRSKRIGAT